jgi:hypothetical protein
MKNFKQTIDIAKMSCGFTGSSRDKYLPAISEESWARYSDGHRHCILIGLMALFGSK